MTYQKLKEILESMSPEELNQRVNVYIDDHYANMDLIRDEDYPEEWVFIV